MTAQAKVILVDRADNPVGEMEKMKAHREGMLHRAYSIVIFNDKHEMLLQKRAAGKYHSAGLWTNTCCSHPAPGEELIESARKRLQFEMGFDTSLSPAFSFIYRSDFENGLTEYEFDHVLIGRHDGSVYPEINEVSEYAWSSMDKIRDLILAAPGNFTSWFKIAFPKMEDYLASHPW